MRRMFVLFLVLFPLIAHGEEVCDISKDLVDADVEETPLKDKDYSETEVLKALDGLKIFFSEKDQGQYFIPENYMMIIKGGFLLRRTKLIKIKIEGIDKTRNPSYRYLDLSSDYEKAKKEYCEYRQSHYLHDW